MTSCCYGGSAADHAVSQQLPVKRSLLQSQDHLAENSSACSTRSVSMHSDHTGTTRFRHMHSAAAGARAAPLSCSSTGMAWSSPPAESGPIVVDTPLVSWASYSQAANSVFSTKPPASQVSLLAVHQLYSFLIEDLLFLQCTRTSPGAKTSCHELQSFLGHPPNPQQSHWARYF
jgi:hypothetical protein